jgi:Flp pilus assembly pilin Flp
MLRYLRAKKGQSLIEYSLILGAIIVGILFMQLYVRRAIQGRLRDASDQIGDQFSPSAKYNLNITRDSKTIESTDATGQTTTTFEYDTTTREGGETLKADNEEDWMF